MESSSTNPTPATDERLLLLSPTDNVYITTQAFDEIPLGHKVAARSIMAGEKMIKCGMPIGLATCDIAPGEHVHTHNLKSDYLPTFTLEAGREFIKS